MEPYGALWDIDFAVPQKLSQKIFWLAPEPAVLLRATPRSGAERRHWSTWRRMLV